MQPLAKAASSGEVRTRLPQTRAFGPPATGTASLRAICTGGAVKAASAPPIVSMTRRFA